MNSSTFSSNPYDLFVRWLHDAEQTKMVDPNAIALATVNEQGQPQVRIVLLKEVRKDAGFIFYTNYESDKGRALLANPRASFDLFWRELDRQIRVEGVAHPTSSEVSDAYFASRARRSQLGAWASEQSRPLESYDIFMERFAYFEQKFAGKEVPRPAHWGGFLLVPSRIEFWQAEKNRLHHRVVYVKENVSAGWSVMELNP